MTIYDVLYGTEHHASVSVHDNREKRWTFNGERTTVRVDATSQKAIEAAIAQVPHATRVHYGAFTSQRRAARG